MVLSRMGIMARGVAMSRTTGRDGEAPVVSAPAIPVYDPQPMGDALCVQASKPQRKD